MGVKIRQKPKGSGVFWIFVNHNGKRTSKKIGIDEGAACEVAKKIEARLALNEFNFEKEKPIPAFKQVADSWIKTTVPATCKESTESDYQLILDKHLLPVFGELKIYKITKGKIKDFLFSKVTAGYASSTIYHFKNAVSGVLTQAVDNDLISVNPTLNLGKNFMKKINDAIEARKVSNGNEGEGDPDPLSKKELKLLMDTVKKHYPEHYPLFLVFARTGVRAGEALGLQWGDIDFNSRFINLKRSFSRGAVSTLKGKRSRLVDMSLQLVAVLKDHMLDCKKKGVKLGLGGLPEYVFTNTKGNPTVLNNWRKRVFWKALEKAELRRIRIHDLRHTYATLRISKGDNIADVSKQLGHHSVKFTWDTYYHWMPGKKKSEVDELDDREFKTRHSREVEKAV
jgi:integrase